MKISDFFSKSNTKAKNHQSDKNSSLLKFSSKENNDSKNPNKSDQISNNIIGKEQNEESIITTAKNETQEI